MIVWEECHQSEGSSRQFLLAGTNNSRYCYVDVELLEYKLFKLQTYHNQYKCEQPLYAISEFKFLC